MARTKAEVRKFLDSQISKSVNAKSRPYQGQCVSLVKALLEFLGAPNPYAARGNAKDYGDTLLRQGIAKNGDGWLRVVVNRSMGRVKGQVYGHIWLDLRDETNYEQNGARALHTTKGTRPYSQRQQVVNLDKYIKDDAPKPPAKQYHIVKSGDTVDSISRKYKLKIDTKQSGIQNDYPGFKKLNPGVKDVNKISIGQKVRVR